MRACIATRFVYYPNRSAVREAPTMEAVESCVRYLERRRSIHLRMPTLEREHELKELLKVWHIQQWRKKRKKAAE